MYSSHPDHNEVLNYIRQTGNNSKQNGGKLKKVFLVHGETPQLEAMQKAVEAEDIATVCIPDMNEIYTL